MPLPSSPSPTRTGNTSRSQLSAGDARGPGGAKLHVLTVPDADRAFYSKGTYDIEYEFPFGVQELEGVAYRTDYDLKQHQEASGKPLDYFDEFFATPHATLSMLHYPPQKEIGNRQYGIAPHTDNALMTFLAQSNVPGLAVQMPSRRWRSWRCG